MNSIESKSETSENNTNELETRLYAFFSNSLIHVVTIELP